MRPWLSALAGALLAVLAAAPAAAGQVTVDMLDVGQGDAILIRGGGKTVLIDSGDRSANTPDQLRALQVERLDLVVGTHPHADHIGRMPAVLRDFDVGLYMDSGLTHTTRVYNETMVAVEDNEVPYKTAVTGMQLRLGDEAELAVLWPGARPVTGTRSDLNSNSVVLRLDHGENSFLFTGDAEEPTERGLLRGAASIDVDVLKVAHHGSAHSSESVFLNAVKPQYALVSVGHDNRYGHPDPEALDRLRAVGAMVYRTDQSGGVRVVSDGHGLEVLEGSLQDLDGVEVLPTRLARPTTEEPPEPMGEPPAAPPPVQTAPPTGRPPVATLTPRQLKRLERKEARARAREQRKADKALRKNAY